MADDVPNSGAPSCTRPCVAPCRTPQNCPESPIAGARPQTRLPRGHEPVGGPPRNRLSSRLRTRGGRVFWQDSAWRSYGTLRSFRPILGCWTRSPDAPRVLPHWGVRRSRWRGGWLEGVQTWGKAGSESGLARRQFASDSFDCCACSAIRRSSAAQRSRLSFRRMQTRTRCGGGPYLQEWARLPVTSLHQISP